MRLAQGQVRPVLAGRATRPPRAHPGQRRGQSQPRHGRDDEDEEDRHRAPAQGRRGADRLVSGSDPKALRESEALEVLSAPPLPSARLRPRIGVVALHVPPAVESRHAKPPSPREEPTMPTSHEAPPKFETVLYEKTGPICRITLNRPEKLNAATDQLVEEVNDALFEFDADPALQVAILSGAGRAFCSGPTCSSASSAHPRRCAGSAGRPDAARGRTVSATPST